MKTCSWHVALHHTMQTASLWCLSFWPWARPYHYHHDHPIDLQKHFNIFKRLERKNFNWPASHKRFIRFKPQRSLLISLVSKRTWRVMWPLNQSSGTYVERTPALHLLWLSLCLILILIFLWIICINRFCISSFSFNIFGLLFLLFSWVRCAIAKQILSHAWTKTLPKVAFLIWCESNKIPRHFSSSEALLAQLPSEVLLLELPPVHCSFPATAKGLHTLGWSKKVPLHIGNAKKT